MSKHPDLRAVSEAQASDLRTSMDIVQNCIHRDALLVKEIEFLRGADHERELINEENQELFAQIPDAMTDIVENYRILFKRFTAGDMTLNQLNTELNSLGERDDLVFQALNTRINMIRAKNYARTAATQDFYAGDGINPKVGVDLETAIAEVLPVVQPAPVHDPKPVHAVVAGTGVMLTNVSANEEVVPLSDSDLEKIRTMKPGRIIDLNDVEEDEDDGQPIPAFLTVGAGTNVHTLHPN